MEGGQSQREMQEQKRGRPSRTRLILILVCVLVIVVASLFGLRGRGETGAPKGSAATAVTGTTIGPAAATSGPAPSAADPVASSTAPPASTFVAEATTTSTTAVPSPNTTVAEYNPTEPGDVRVPGSFYGPVNTAFPGLTMFRGNASRTYYGEGPVPSDPKILWKFGPMSGFSADYGVTRTWTGTGWTGQPCIFERGGKTWVVFGAYDWRIHFLDGDTGERLLPDFKGGDIFKGSAVCDPDGYPLVFMGCRDNNWRIISIDRDKPTELFKLNAYDVSPRVWNDDWDSSVVIRNDYAFFGGENSHFFILKLNRGYDGDGKVTVHPKIVLDLHAWSQALFDKLGDRDVSVENSPCLVGDRVYFSNSGGLIHGLDVSKTLEPLQPGESPASGTDSYPVVFKYWTGDDTDASIVADEQGFLYVCMELQRFLPRAKEIGQIIKLDPRKNEPGEDPLVWSVPVADLVGGLSGVWATPCLYKDMVYVPTHSGALLGIDRQTGAIVWKKKLTEHAWGSCVVVDNMLMVGDTYGTLHAWDVSDTRADPPAVWEFKVPSGSALESTPAVWKGRIYMGCRDGYFYSFGDE